MSETIMIYTGIREGIEVHPTTPMEIFEALQEEELFDHKGYFQKYRADRGVSETRQWIIDHVAPFVEELWARVTVDTTVWEEKCENAGATPCFDYGFVPLILNTMHSHLEPDVNEIYKELLEDLEPKPVDTDPILVNRANPESWLEAVWAGLHCFREDCIPEGEDGHDAQWDDICTAMAWIREELGLIGEVEKETS